MCACAMAQAPAFPGAEGNGRFVTGGRGGKVVHVTNLNDSGEGSLRSAVSGSDKKIVVFDVGGVIALSSDLSIGDNTTIEGQTAPSPGITIRYYTVRPRANNIIRFIRFRRGEEKSTNDGADCIWQRNYTGIILDHCSMSWSTDELASFYDNNNFTMQWCMLGEGLNSGHSKGAHSYGGIWGGKLASFHHNFLGFVQNRVPRFCGARYNWQGYKNNKEYSTYNWKSAVEAENVDFRNCVMYNWSSGGCYGGPGGGHINMVNNYYKAGPATANKTQVTQITVGAKGNSEENSIFWGLASQYYINGNYVAGAPAGQQENYDWKGVSIDGKHYTIDDMPYCKDSLHYYGTSTEYKSVEDFYLTNERRVGRRRVYDTVWVKFDCAPIHMEKPIAPAGQVTTHSAKAAYEQVLNYAGASLYRDAIDAGYVKQTRDSTAIYTGSIESSPKPGIIDISTDNKDCYSETTPGWGLTKSTKVDSDGDGMPDDWETANGLNPNDPSDASTYTLDARGWYTNIEVYCNELVENIMKSENANAETAVDEYYPVIATTGISSIHTPTAINANAPIYNVAGQQVNKSYKGIVIQNGKKFIQK